MRHWLLVCCVACHSEPHNMPLAPDVAVENSVSIVDAGASNAEMADAVSPQRILLIGDSEVRYNNWYFSAANVKKPTETVFFDSKPGTTIGAWNSIFVSEMAKYPKIDVILIFLGTNNFNFSFLQPHQNILDEVKRRNIKCVWIGPTDVRWSGIKNLHMTGPLIKAAVSSTCTYFDAEAANIELADGIHPTKRGSIKWLTLIWEVKDKL